MLRLFDTAAGEVHGLVPRDPGKVSMYVCGPTVYGPPHIGHGRTVLAHDILRRYLTWAGNEVRLVSNVTDIDDNIINRAEAESRPWTEIAERCETQWFRGMDALGARRPDETPHATQFVEEMVALIGRLVADGFAYELDDGVYLEVDRVPGYGLLAGQPLDSLRSGARVETRDEKRSPLDFVLWKKSKPGEPSWPSPWGEGRPGWHTECVVMSLGLLGESFDIHGGGLDLRFPHHENERAQAVAEGREFARLWFHTGMLEVDGEKMSKSLGNVRNLLDLVEQYDPRAFRLLVLQSHYRAPMGVSDETMRAAVKSLESLDRFAERFGGADAEPDADAIERFRSVMDDDLGTPAAMALLFDLVRRANASDDERAAAAALEIARAVGLDLRSEAEAIGDDALALASARDEKRAAKDWAGADAIRDELVAMGYEVADTPTGTQLRRR
jgi:cysteinyl-tRNA synthetase